MRAPCMHVGDAVPVVGDTGVGADDAIGGVLAVELDVDKGFRLYDSTIFC